MPTQSYALVKAKRSKGDMHNIANGDCATIGNYVLGGIDEVR